jgi:hypothetical protein
MANTDDMYNSDFVLMHRVRAAKKRYLALDTDRAVRILQKTLDGLENCGCGGTNLASSDRADVCEHMNMAYFMVVLDARKAANDHMDAIITILRANIRKTGLLVKRLKDDGNTGDASGMLGMLDRLCPDTRELIIRRI